jgi:hypothetical protein
MIKSLTFIAVVGLMGSMFFNSCATKKNDQKSESMTQEMKPAAGVPSPPAIVYKTKENYNLQVPVILSDDKSRIVSFPAQSDIRIDGKYAYPTELVDGYLLDNRGINQNAAFLRFTYEDYYTMDNIPTAARLMNYILDDDPFIEMYEVGRLSNFRNPVEEINKMILDGNLGEKRDLLNR